MCGRVKRKRLAHMAVIRERDVVTCWPASCLTRQRDSQMKRLGGVQRPAAGDRSSVSRRNHKIVGLEPGESTLTAGVLV
jgi:hypothetical protein